MVVTIIVLLILAGVSISLVFNSEGLFKKASSATNKYSEEKAKEELTLVLSNIQMKKYGSRLTEVELETEIDVEIAKVGELLPKIDPTSNIQQVIIGEYIFEIDRSVPKITDRGCLGKANEVIVTATITQNGDWKNPGATVTGTITKYGGGTVVSSTATATNGVTTPADFPTTGGSYTITNIKIDTVITITTTDSEGNTKTHTITVKLVRDTTPPVISEEKAITDNELNITISAKATDGESGVASFKYTISPTTGLSTSEGELPQDGTAVTITSTVEETYTITLTATDNEGNHIIKEIQEIKTVDGGVIKHIKLSDGTLKEVNTRDIYGATVEGYTCTRTGVEWQIFYIDEADSHRVYLISKEYMAPPVNSTTVTPKLLASSNSSFPKACRFGTTGSDQSVLKSFTGNLATTPVTYNKFINDYLKEYSNGLNASSSQPNLQATKLMLDQDYWAEYNGEKADLAFGGPTLPLFQASYNDICRTATKLGIQQSGTGYQRKIGAGNYSSDNVSGFGDTSTQNRIYFKGNKSNSASGMWLASPASGSSISVMCTKIDTKILEEFEGMIGGNGYFHYSEGFRPIVSLQTNVQFTSNADGTVYTIAN